MKVFECVRQGRDGTYLDLHVVPASKREAIDYDEYGKRLRLRVCSPAVDGQANKAVIAHLSQLFGSCELVCGQKGRKKTVLIRGGEINRVLSQIEQALNR